MVDLDYLRTVPILRLQSAARQAGLAFRSGSLDKAGIISRLEAFPALGAATVAVLKRQEREGMSPPAPNPVQRAIAPVDNLGWDDDTPSPSPAPSPAPSPISSDPALRESIDAILRKLGDYVTHAEHKKAHETLAGSISRVAAAQYSLADRLEALEKTRPVEFHLGQGPSFPPVDFGGELTHEKLPTLIQVLLAGEQAYLAGPAGSGKTTAAKQARKVLAAAFGRGDDYQCLAIGAVADSFALLGYKDATGEYRRTLFREAYEKGHLFLWDEVDGSAADAQLVVNSLDNGFVSFPDGVIHAHPHFRIICGGNTKGAGATLSYSGRHALDGAFLDRFSMIEWGLDPRIETRLSRGLSSWLEAVRAIRAYAEKREILDVLATARAVRRGPAFLEQGMPRMAVLETTCKRGALDSCWPEILRLPAVDAFLKEA